MAIEVIADGGFFAFFGHEGVELEVCSGWRGYGEVAVTAPGMEVSLSASPGFRGMAILLFDVGIGVLRVDVDFGFGFVDEVEGYQAVLDRIEVGIEGEFVGSCGDVFGK